MALNYFKRADIYKNSTGTNKVSGDKKSAFSYDWWQYLKEIDGVLVFNNYSYSNSTIKHQIDTRRLLNHQGYITVSTRESLNNPMIDLKWVENHLIDKLEELKGKKKRSRKYKSLYRKQIKELVRELRQLRGATND